MGRQSIFSALSVASVVPMTSRNDLIEFLINNRHHILKPSDRANAFKVGFSGHNPISEIVHKILMLGKDSTFNLINLPSKTASLREVVDLTFIPFDILQLKDVTPSYSKSLSLIPELNDKIVINITDIMKSNGAFSDITQFHWRIVRDFLSRSFYVSPGNSWLTPALVRYIAKVYSMTMGAQIGKLFNLSPVAQNFIQTVFCLFFVGQMTNTDSAASFIRANARAVGIRDAQELVQITAFVEDILNKKAPESLEEVFAVIDAYGNEQISSPQGSRLTRPVLAMKFQNLFPESHVSSIALEYPPYFFFLILLVMSGVKLGLSFHMKSLNLDKEGKEIIDQAIKSPLFTHGF